MRDASARSVVPRRNEVEDVDRYPFSIPAVRTLEELALDPHATFPAGENGSGKSTLVEAIASPPASAPRRQPQHGRLDARLSLGAARAPAARSRHAYASR